MEIKGQEIGTCRHRDDELEVKISDAKGWVNAPDNEARRKAFQHMAKLIAQRSPDYIRELEYQQFGYYL